MKELKGWPFEPFDVLLILADYFTKRLAKKEKMNIQVQKEKAEKENEELLRNLLKNTDYYQKIQINDGSKFMIMALEKRIQTIESRLPSSATIDKISSVNDAILATNIESLTRTVKRIEEKMLTKWDVAVVMFQIIGVIGVVIGVIIGVITLFS